MAAAWLIGGGSIALNLQNAAFLGALFNSDAPSIKREVEVLYNVSWAAAVPAYGLCPKGALARYTSNRGRLRSASSWSAFMLMTHTLASMGRPLVRSCVLQTLSSLTSRAGRLDEAYLLPCILGLSNELGDASPCWVGSDRQLSDIGRFAKEQLSKTTARVLSVRRLHRAVALVSKPLIMRGRVTVSGGTGALGSATASWLRRFPLEALLVLGRSGRFATSHGQAHLGKVRSMR
jgi:hypothetical protein